MQGEASNPSRATAKLSRSFHFPTDTMMHTTEIASRITEIVVCDLIARYQQQKRHG